KEAFFIITTSSNIQDCTNKPLSLAEKVIIPISNLCNSTLTLFDNSRVNSFDDHNEESAEVEDESIEIPS
ncbi:9288_t:CDS:1, partial [Racocetra fulgida]